MGVRSSVLLLDQQRCGRWLARQPRRHHRVSAEDDHRLRSRLSALSADHGLQRESARVASGEGGDMAAALANRQICKGTVTPGRKPEEDAALRNWDLGFLLWPFPWQTAVCGHRGILAGALHRVR